MRKNVKNKNNQNSKIWTTYSDYLTRTIYLFSSPTQNIPFKTTILS